MTSVFRIATEQAIREIVEENSVSGRFGLIITEENITEISKKVVDLFEMTLQLRAKTQDIFGGAQTKNDINHTDKDIEASFPKTKNASEIYYREPNTNTFSEAKIAPHLNVKLPRQRYELTLEEKERYMRR